MFGAQGSAGFRDASKDGQTDRASSFRPWATESGLGPWTWMTGPALTLGQADFLLSGLRNLDPPAKQFTAPTTKNYVQIRGHCWSSGSRLCSGTQLYRSGLFFLFLEGGFMKTQAALIP